MLKRELKEEVEEVVETLLVELVGEPMVGRVMVDLVEDIVVGLVWWGWWLLVVSCLNGEALGLVVVGERVDVD